VCSSLKGHPVRVVVHVVVVVLLAYLLEGRRLVVQGRRCACHALHQTLEACLVSAGIEMHGAALANQRRWWDTKASCDNHVMYCVHTCRTLPPLPPPKARRKRPERALQLQLQLLLVPRDQLLLVPRDQQHQPPLQSSRRHPRLRREVAQPKQVNNNNSNRRQHHRALQL
jgi:hypothetical protein